MTVSDYIKRDGYFVIAEAGSAHEGSLEAAKALIKEAGKAGAHAIKFQAFTKDSLFACNAYIQTLGLPSHALDDVDRLAFKDEWFPLLAEEARKMGVLFMNTPFSPEAVDKLEAVNVKAYKVASSDIQYIPLLEKIAKTKKPVILSTGLAFEEDIERALALFKDVEVTLLHCAVEYPPSPAHLNLAYIGALAKRYGALVGFSDHTRSPITPALAAMEGARVFEKHFTLTPDAKTGDHPISVDPIGLKQMIEHIRFALPAKGVDEKTFSEAERRELVFARRGIYLAVDLPKGTALEETHLCCLRPCIALNASDWHSVIGKRLTVDKKRHTALEETDIE